MVVVLVGATPTRRRFCHEDGAALARTQEIDATAHAPRSSGTLGPRAMPEPVVTSTLPPFDAAERVDMVFVVDGETTTRPLPLAGRVVIGRTVTVANGVTVAHPSLSREHAALTVPELSLEDLGSTNGTFLHQTLPDGTRAETRLVPGCPVALRPGATVRLGGVTLVLVPTFVRERSAVAPAEGVPAEPPQLDPRMREVHALIERVAPADIPVLLLGETGVGKEVLAERIHGASPRRHRPMLRLNCAALSEQLVESELFGHERGAFTGAVTAKPGLLEGAAGGTVLLDEIGDLRLESQAKLLRVIEEGKALRVGGVTARPVDVRFLAATHRDLERAVAAGTFRQDLYYRLAGVVLRIPPLRERPAELLPLAVGFLRAACARYQRPGDIALARDAEDFLAAHPWPGNIRELRNFAENAVVLRRGGKISEFDLEPRFRGETAPPPSMVTATPANPYSVEDNEKRLLKEALMKARGNRTKAAQLLGISRRTLHRKIAEWPELDVVDRG